MSEQHWDAAYAGGDEDRSWTEHGERDSFPIICELARRDDAILDVGGGSSRLAGDLAAAGYRDVTVVDISPAALRLARDRAPDAALLQADVLAWSPPRRYALWHDRAVLHFFTDDGDRRRYVDTLRRALAVDGHVVIASFAPDGPDRCSGLPVRRAGVDELAALLGPPFAVVRAWRAVHTTPAGADQPFTWVVARHDAAS